MKKIIFILSLMLLFSYNSAFADEIIDSQGNTTKCKIETVLAGFIEYKKDGNLHSFTRENTSPIFSDYVDVRNGLFKRHTIKRYYGTIIIKDFWQTDIIVNDVQQSYPFYKVKFVGIYKP